MKMDELNMHCGYSTINLMKGDKKLEESIIQILSKEIKMDSGEIIKISVELINIKEKNNGIVKNFLETMLKEIKELF